MPIVSVALTRLHLPSSASCRPLRVVRPHAIIKHHWNR